MREYLFAGFVVLAMMLAGCTGDRETVPGDGFGAAESVEPAPVDDTMKPAPVDVVPGDPIPDVPEAVGLPFSPVEPSAAQLVTDPASLREKLTLDHHLLVYAKGSGESGLYLGQRRGDEVWEFGEIGEEHYLADLAVSDVQVFGGDVIVVRGLCGAACAINYVLDKGNETLEPFYVVYGGLQVVDWDGDGIDEWLVESGTPVELTLYDRVNGQIVSADVNPAIGTATGVVYRGVFETVVEHQTLHYRYDRDTGRLVLVHKMNAVPQ